MWENYRAWEIDFNEFYRQASERDRLRFLVRFAVLAPSSHNSQPWRFEVRAGKIIVYPDMQRALPQGDADNRQLFISIGCAIENLVVAADYYGFRTDIQHHGAGTTVLFQKIGEKPSHEGNHLIFSIPKRHTNRNPYEIRLPDRQFLSWAASQGREEMRIDCVTEQGAKEKIASAVIAAGIMAMENDAFREELSHFVKSNITGAKIGMPAFGVGIPTPVSFVTPFMLKHFNMNKVSKRQDSALLKEQTLAFLIISSREDNIVSWMRAGQVYERIALEAERQNIRTAPMAAAIEMRQYRMALQDVLGISLLPHVFFRAGYTEKLTPHSPRLSASEVITEVMHS